jgi:phage baseplate assembly protein V
MGKNILSDTDYTKGWDNRFQAAVVIGKVSDIDASNKGANVRVIMPDRIDHNGTPLISKPIPVMQIASNAKKSFAMPRIGDNVMMVKLPNGTSNYAVVGSFYTSKSPPPVTDPKLDYVIYDDGSIMQFDASKGELTWKLKGDMLWDNEKSFTLKLQTDFTLTPQGKVTINPQGDVLIQSAGQITLESGTINLKGNIVHTGNMTTSGHHADAKGPHAASTREDLEARVARLEALLGAVEIRLAQLEALRGVGPSGPEARHGS